MNFNVSKEDSNKSGIYIISNSVNSKIYIGSTVNFYARYKNHTSDLVKNKHENPKLQNFVNKYNINNLSFKILKLCNAEKLYRIEQVYLDFYQSYENGFNIAKDTFKTRFGIKSSQDTKNKISKVQKNKVLNEKGYKENLIKRLKEYEMNNPDSRSINMKKFHKSLNENPELKEKYCLNLSKKDVIKVYKDDILIDEIVGIIEVTKKYNISSGVLGDSLNYNRKILKGKFKGYKFTCEGRNSIDRVRNNNNTILVSKNGVYIETLKSLLEVSLKYNLHCCTIKKLIKNKSESKTDKLSFEIINI